MKRYKIILDEIVIKNDLKKIDNSILKIISKNIKQKLEVAPYDFGKPLSGNLTAHGH